MSALTLHLHKNHNFFHKKGRQTLAANTTTVSERLSQVAWFTVAFLLSVAAGPFAAIGVVAAIFSLAKIETEEPMPREA